ncbi:pyridoxine 5'-phosphate synthase [bacterium]|nr:pyridoxine 5'-phosphate synthase [bacterium]
MTDLLINIDHVATLRNARRERFPDPVAAAKECLEGGAKGIVFHLRADRRHIMDADVYRLKAELDTKLDFELSTVEEIVAICCQVQPALATLVPERREEITTEGGLNVIQSAQRLTQVIPRLLDAGIGDIALFVDPDIDQIDEAARLGATTIELHTGDFANATSPEEAASILKRFKAAATRAHNNGLKVHAGHGLDYDNYPAFGSAVPYVEEVSIGFAIVARSVFTGMRSAVSEMNRLVIQSNYNG